MAGFAAALPGRRYPIADSNGVINQPWYDFFQNFFNRTGGNAADIVDSALTLAHDADDLALTLLDAGQGSDDRLRRAVNDAAAQLAEIERPDYDRVRRRLNDLETLLAGIDTGGGTPAPIAVTVPTSFTPVLQIGGATTGITYSHQIGRYTTVGKKTEFHITIDLTSKGSATGALTVNLPVTTENTANQRPQIGSVQITGTFTGTASGSAVENSTSLSLIVNNGGTISNLTDTNITNTSSIYISGSYISA